MSATLNQPSTFGTTEPNLKRLHARVFYSLIYVVRHISYP